MSEDPAQYGPPYLAERERQRLTFRLLADCVENADRDQLADTFQLLPSAAQYLFRQAELLFKRPFGE